MKKRLPFSLLKRSDRRYYTVRFKNEQTGKYLPEINTKKETEKEAIQIVFEWLKDGIPQQGETVSLKKYTLREMAKGADITKVNAEFICKELHRQGLLKSYILEESVQVIDFITYLTDFWDWEKSTYIKEKLRRNHGMHRRYAIEMTGAVNKYWIPFFQGKHLGDITRQDIEAFIAYLESLPKQAEKEQTEIDKTLQEEAEREKAEIEAGLRKPKRKNAASKIRRIVRFPQSASRKNSIIKAGTVPLAWAFQKEMIDKDIVSGITWFSGKSRERQILSPEQAKTLFRVSWKDERSRLANILAMVTGMRAGEIQGLRIQDLGQDCLYVRHSWNFQDGLKTTKNNETRIVEVPFPGLIHELIGIAKSNPHGHDMDSFVFWAEKFPNKPIEQDIFRRDLKDALIKTGLSKKSAKAYTFHSWRHYFTAYMRDKITEKLLQSQTGHKTMVMLETIMPGIRLPETGLIFRWFICLYKIASLYVFYCLGNRLDNIITPICQGG
ncbi:MAG: site-specific integrase [Treponema sp.]|nr:site-specific integrase [Treponema sp.]